MQRLMKWLGFLILSPVMAIGLCLFAALLGGIIPGGFKSVPIEQSDEYVTLFLTGTLLHTDIAIPVTPQTREAFGFLENSPFPYHAEGLKFFVVGWGARDFYTATGSYSDIRLATAWKAATGDEAVLHFGPAGPMEPTPDMTTLRMSVTNLKKLTGYITDTLAKRDERAVLLRGAGFGFGDVFYHAKGNFNLFNPCNVWVSNALAASGQGHGIWTPTSYSVQVSQWLYNS